MGVDILDTPVDKILLTGITREPVPSYTIGSYKVMINNTITCFYCEKLNIFGRNHYMHAECDSTHTKIILERDIYYKLRDMLESSFEMYTEHGSGWKISKERLEQLLFDVML